MPRQRVRTFIRHLWCTWEVAMYVKTRQTTTPYIFLRPREFTIAWLVHVYPTSQMIVSASCFDHEGTLRKFQARPYQGSYSEHMMPLLAPALQQNAKLPNAMTHVPTMYRFGQAGRIALRIQPTRLDIQSVGFASCLVAGFNLQPWNLAM